MTVGFIGDVATRRSRKMLRLHFRSNRRNHGALPELEQGIRAFASVAAVIVRHQAGGACSENHLRRSHDRVAERARVSQDAHMQQAGEADKDKTPAQIRSEKDAKRAYERSLSNIPDKGAGIHGAPCATMMRRKPPPRPPPRNHGSRISGHAGAYALLLREFCGARRSQARGQRRGAPAKPGRDE